MKRAAPIMVALAFTLARGACAEEEARAREEEAPSAKQEEELVLAMAVDSLDWPEEEAPKEEEARKAAELEEAAALEVRPYRLLLEKARVGPDEPTLRALETFGWSHRKLVDSPDQFRGKVVLVSGMIAEVRPVRAPGVGRHDRDRVYAGVIARGRQVPRSSPPEMVLELYAFRALRRPYEAPLYAGDRVVLSGYFFKIVPVIDNRGGTRRMPLVVGPWPTYPVPRRKRRRGEGGLLRKWYPIRMAARQVGLAGLLPTREPPHDDVYSRLVVDVRKADGKDRGLAVDGVAMSRGDAAAELARYAAAHPDRAIVVRTEKAAAAAARELLAEAGVERFVLKELPALSEAGRLDGGD